VREVKLSWMVRGSGVVQTAYRCGTSFPFLSTWLSALLLSSNHFRLHPVRTRARSRWRWVGCTLDGPMDRRNGHSVERWQLAHIWRGTMSHIAHPRIWPGGHIGANVGGRNFPTSRFLERTCAHLYHDRQPQHLFFSHRTSPSPQRSESGEARGPSLCLRHCGQLSAT
jgi:hypothetical protein